MPIPITRSCVLCLVLSSIALAEERIPAEKTIATIPAHVLLDKIRGGLLGQILGNLNGLPHEMEYIDDPGNVAEYIPSLPEGARTMRNKSG